MTNEFHAVCPVSELEEGEIKLVEVDQQLVILFLHEGQYYCIDDVCTHDGGTLSDGEVIGCAIACPRHGAQFDLCSGRALTMPATHDTVAHEVRVVDGQIAVRLSESE